MNQAVPLEAYGGLIDGDTLKLQRVLPGPPERVWAFLTENEKRRQWLAAGKMEPKAGTSVELVWRNDELTDPPGKRPEGFGEEHRMESRIVTFDPPRKLEITWAGSGNVSFELEPKGSQVLLTVIRRRLPDRDFTLKHSAGWHMHLDFLVARASGRQDPGPFWDGWSRLMKDYNERMPVR